MKWLLLILVVGCSPAAAEPKPAAVATDSSEGIKELEDRLKVVETRLANLEKHVERLTDGNTSGVLSGEEVDSLLENGTGHDYAKLTTAERKHLCMTIQQLVKASTPIDIFIYLNGIYDGSNPEVMNQRIGEMAAAGVTLMELQDHQSPRSGGEPATAPRQLAK